jgi:hypothetical protein
MRKLSKEAGEQGIKSPQLYQLSYGPGIGPLYIAPRSVGHLPHGGTCARSVASCLDGAADLDDVGFSLRPTGAGARRPYGFGAR